MQQAAAYQALHCSQRDWKQGDEAAAGKGSHAGQLASRGRSQVCCELACHLWRKADAHYQRLHAPGVKRICQQLGVTVQI